jgi:cytochrome oxidase Cu insertion factor (SCO1/SenC/PrrC family)
MIPHEKTLVERLKNKPFALIGINTDEDKDEYHKKAKEMGVTWRSSWQGTTAGVLPRAWGITSFPTIFVLDAKGVIRYIGVRGEDMDKAVDTLLAELEGKK